MNELELRKIALLIYEECMVIPLELDWDDQPPKFNIDEHLQRMAAAFQTLLDRGDCTSEQMIARLANIGVTIVFQSEQVKGTLLEPGNSISVSEICERIIKSNSEIENRLWADEAEEHLNGNAV